MLSKLSKTRVVFLILGVILFVIALFRANNLSMTHDECASIFGLIHSDNYLFLFNKGEWLTANNHWLNTMSFQFFHLLFGMKALALRFGSVLMAPIFTYATYFICKKLDLDFYIQILVAALLLTSPILLDYFSLARGYGMAITFVMTSLAFILAYLDGNNKSALIGFVVSAILSTLSIFSNIIFYFVFCGVLALLLWRLKKLTKSFFIITAIGLIVLAILTYIPISALSKADEFRWGTDILTDSFASYFSEFNHHQKYMGKPEILVGVFGTFIALAIIAAFVFLSRKPNSLKEEFFVFISMAFLGFILSMLITNLALNAKFPIDRKTLIYLPFFGLIIALYADLLLSEGMKKFVGIVVGGFLFFHFYKSLNMNGTWEWWYDANTEELVKNIEDLQKDVPAKVGVHWMFLPASNYYNHFFYEDKLELIHYTNGDVINESLDYYLIFMGDYEPFREKFDILEERPASQQLLIKKKSQ
ncbi:MAG: hypothetical protein WAT92_24835 [Saprospiraceae bacterium]|nr:hypothetical protein [Saprospiraceae bacterium]